MKQNRASDWDEFPYKATDYGPSAYDGKDRAGHPSVRAVPFDRSGGRFIRTARGCPLRRQGRQGVDLWRVVEDGAAPPAT